MAKGYGFCAMLEQMTNRLRARETLRAIVDTILTDVIALHGAEFGNIQLASGDELILVGERGLGREFVRAFSRVTKADTTGCARAFRSGEAIVIADINQDPEFKPYVQAAAAVGFQAVQSTPLISSDGELLGVVSTHFASPHEPTPIEMDTVVKYAGIAADRIKRNLGARSILDEARRLHRELLAPAESA